MTDAQYSIIRSFSAPWMGESEPHGFHLSRGIPSTLPGSRTCVYVTELADGTCAYVGKTRQGVQTRLTQHVREWHKAKRWTQVWVVPILDSVPNGALFRIEGRIGAELRPVDSLRLPRP